jgi:hypothetical protein
VHVSSVAPDGSASTLHEWTGVLHNDSPDDDSVELDTHSWAKFQETRVGTGMLNVAIKHDAVFAPSADGGGVRVEAALVAAQVSGMVWEGFTRAVCC